MELPKAIKIILSLAQGVDPETGEQFPADSPYQRPDTIRALFTALRALENSGSEAASPVSTPSQLILNQAKPPLTEEQRFTLNKLYKWRKGVASSQNIPAFYIAYNSMADEMVRLASPDEEALLKVKGFGAKRVGKYGEAILTLLNESSDVKSFADSASSDISSTEASVTVEERARDLPATANTLESARLRYPASTDYLLLITEVTRMQNDVFCIAAYDAHREKMVRPMLAGRGAWTFDALHPAYRPGQLVSGTPGGIERSLYPHRTEDTPLLFMMKTLETWTESNLHSALMPISSPQIAEIFGDKLVDGKYLIEGTRCPSLGSVKIERRLLRFCSGAQNRIRLEVKENDETLYSLPITCNRLRCCFDLNSDSEAVSKANQRLTSLPSGEIFILRIGLSRGYAGTNGEFNPKRCYLQVNGMLCARGWLPSEAHL